ncbi:hypothetical protein [Amycolatopsis jiangsuensis]|uniref:Uncharacterized protein n=1 Tax=Amycolatopsis jiangsuensis TaxID=1181879 RepID=A0A840IP26_9PSEU|nr:hypothetical protein [Amycolatopsis jiangsuensis]MBB4682952.1 hypothetical protein [Amycolatopsis jiangsuensis]
MFAALPTPMVSAATAAPLVSHEAAVPGIAPTSDADEGVYTDETGKRLGCTPVTGVDNPHRSKTGIAASGHAWWEKGDCTNDTATILVCLYEYYTDGTWRRKACAENGNVKPGSGSTVRVPVRRDCDTTASTSWRNQADVDVNDEIDSSGVGMRQADIPCQVTGPDQ